MWLSKGEGRIWLNTFLSSSLFQWSQVTNMGFLSRILYCNYTGKQNSLRCGPHIHQNKISHAAEGVVPFQHVCWRIIFLCSLMYKKPNLPQNSTMHWLWGWWRESKNWLETASWETANRKFVNIEGLWSSRVQSSSLTLLTVLVFPLTKNSKLRQVWRLYSHPCSWQWHSPPNHKGLSYLWGNLGIFWGSHIARTLKPNYHLLKIPPATLHSMKNLIDKNPNNNIFPGVYLPWWNGMV